jgi:hypothetical protein
MACLSPSKHSVWPHSDWAWYIIAEAVAMDLSPFVGQHSGHKKLSNPSRDASFIKVFGVRRLFLVLRGCPDGDR